MTEKQMDKCPMCGKADSPVLTNCAEVEGCALFEECDRVVKYSAVVCSVLDGGCGAAGGYAPTAEEAIAKWNMRADQELSHDD